MYETRYVVYYRNQGRPEHTSLINPIKTKQLARESARFLRFQGATAVRIKEVYRKREVAGGFVDQLVEKQAEANKELIAKTESMIEESSVNLKQ